MSVQGSYDIQRICADHCTDNVDVVPSHFVLHFLTGYPVCEEEEIVANTQHVAFVDLVHPVFVDAFEGPGQRGVDHHDEVEHHDGLSLNARSFEK